MTMMNPAFGDDDYEFVPDPQLARWPAAPASPPPSSSPKRSGKGEPHARSLSNGRNTVDPHTAPAAGPTHWQSERANRRSDPLGASYGSDAAWCAICGKPASLRRRCRRHKSEHEPNAKESEK